MRIEWIALCGSVDVAETDLVIRNPCVDTALAETFPAKAGTWVAACVLSRWDELGDGRTHQIHYAVAGPRLDTVHSESGPIFSVLKPGPMHHPGWEGRRVEPFRLEWDLIEGGPYEVTVQLDEDEPLSLPYYVLVVPDQSRGAQQ